MLGDLFQLVTGFWQRKVRGSFQGRKVPFIKLLGSNRAAGVASKGGQKLLPAKNSVPKDFPALLQKIKDEK